MDATDIDEDLREAVFDALLPALNALHAQGAKVLAFGLVHRGAAPYILIDRPAGSPTRTESVGPHTDRCSMPMHGCSVEWIVKSLARALS